MSLTIRSITDRESEWTHLFNARVVVSKNDKSAIDAAEFEKKFKDYPLDIVAVNCPSFLALYIEPHDHEDTMAFMRAIRSEYSSEYGIVGYASAGVVGL
jgi:hypothetical protein